MKAINWQTRLAELCQAHELAAELYPTERANDSWVLVEQDVELAWIIYTELRTRIATQALLLRDGVESSALNSLVDLFGLIRCEVVSKRQALTVTSLLIHCLNHHIRPFTARWHAKSDAGELSTLDQRFRFRAELIRLQRTLRALTSVLGQISGDKDAIELLKPMYANGANEDIAQGKLDYGISTQGQHSAEITGINAAERQIINRRRGLLPDEPVHDAVGLAISGGGIRSATFALGVVQVLARRGILKDVDVMSTVSGGGYLGSFITSVLSVEDDGVGLQQHQQPFVVKDQVESQPIRYLRNHSKYLSEGGFKTLTQLAFSAVYGIVISLLLVAPVVLLIALLSIYSFGIMAGSDGVIIAENSNVVSTLSWLVWASLGFVTLCLSVMRNPRREREILEKFAMYLFLGGLAFLLVQEIPYLYRMVTGQAVELFGMVIILPVILGIVGIWFGATTMLGKVAWSLLIFFGPLFFLSLFLVCVELLVRLKEQHFLLPWALIILIFLYAWLGININFASMHLYYRNRLARTYMRKVGESEAVDHQLLSEVNQWNKAPLHLINAAVNLPASRNPELRGRDTDFFIFAQHYCGGPSVGWWPTKEWEAKDPHLDLGTAMAISGAAAAPRMGTFTSARYTTLLAMLNVRLGYWLRKPQVASTFSNSPGGLYFLKELTGHMHENLPFLNVSDGGHIENLGLYELLRRRCRYIVVIDGEADPEHTFGGLLTAIRMAKIDLGVQIDPDLTDLRSGAEHFKRSHFVLIRIDYGIKHDGLPVHGLLLVIKLALTGNEPELLMQYLRDFPAFPHQSTAQQLFTETQFEAYRALGEHAADAAFDPALIDNMPQDTPGWLRELEKRLLPD
jgi:hypothetical protein